MVGIKMEDIDKQENFKPYLDNNTQLFIDKIKANSKAHNIDISLIETAINYIKLYHNNQIRHSGEPYFYHPLEVASLVIMVWTYPIYRMRSKC
ncbi:MAG: hypothetical protein LN568_04140 [Rickettsia endosymbiont of Pseudomimeciton antennatum]|nr:hypothetical protein [Rickettsia endosymbiont of Pseudomimeciton antennatum]